MANLFFIFQICVYIGRKKLGMRRRTRDVYIYIHIDRDRDRDIYDGRWKWVVDCLEKNLMKCGFSSSWQINNYFGYNAPFFFVLSDIFQEESKRWWILFTNREVTHCHDLERALCIYSQCPSWNTCVYIYLLYCLSIAQRYLVAKKVNSRMINGPIVKCHLQSTHKSHLSPNAIFAVGAKFHNCRKTRTHTCWKKRKRKNIFDK